MLNATTVLDPFPLLFCDTLLNDKAGHKMYSFLDGFNGYNQTNMAPKNIHKTPFITKWGGLIDTVMSFGLKNGPP